MRLSIGSALLGIMLVASGLAAAQSGAKPRAVPLATVESVQLSASVERGRQVFPLAPGTELKGGDRVNTGAQSRLLLKLADGSTVRVGERGSFFLDRMSRRDDGVFEAALFVAEGAFRFTTSAIERLAGKREVTIAINNVTAGIRGTDLWGKSTAESDIVCIIEGSAEITPPGEKPFMLDQPLSFYALEGNVSRPVTTVAPDKFKDWAAETETQPGEGVTTRGGKWKITVSSVKKSGEALGVYNELRKAGYTAEILPGKVGEERVYSVRLSNFESEKDAKFVAEKLKGEADLGKHDYKVGK